ncbi:TY-Chap domain-containing protein [Propionibacteriaceae bacterium G57]|uniref:TY-Chap domain-containing protein n=1 Tax=Aestuariimicrobium sp. G57 TaxID=3418485 RepID=UPI003DA767D4
MDSPQFNFDAMLDEQWHDFHLELARQLARPEMASWHVGLGDEHDDTERGPFAILRVYPDDDEVTLEVNRNAEVAPRYQLSRAQMATVRNDLGLHAEGMGHYQGTFDWSRCADVAEVVGRYFREVIGVPAPSFLVWHCPDDDAGEEDAELLSKVHLVASLVQEVLGESAVRHDQDLFHWTIDGEFGHYQASVLRNSDSLRLSRTWQLMTTINPDDLLRAINRINYDVGPRLVSIGDGLVSAISDIDWQVLSGPRLRSMAAEFDEMSALVYAEFRRSVPHSDEPADQL